MGLRELRDEGSREGLGGGPGGEQEREGPLKLATPAEGCEGLQGSGPQLCISLPFKGFIHLNSEAGLKRGCSEVIM